VSTAPLPDAFAEFLGIEVVGSGSGAAARVTVAAQHLNPHGTTHGSFLYSLAGVALAAAANDAEHSGIVSAVHIDYLRPSGPGDELRATARVAERLPREDLFEVRVVREPGDDLIARASGRATRRTRG
jgi:acyl-CoA thioesterase